MVPPEDQKRFNPKSTIVLRKIPEPMMYRFRSSKKPSAWSFLYRGQSNVTKNCLNSNKSTLKPDLKHNDKQLKRGKKLLLF